MKTRHSLLFLILALGLLLGARTVGQATADSLIYLPLVRRSLPPSTTRVSIASDGTEGNDSSGGPAISADGRFIAFTSRATNLVPGDTNTECYSDRWGEWIYNCADVFVHDRQSGQTTRVSVANDGTQGNANSGNPSISADGRFIAFESVASNLVDGDTNSGTYCWSQSFHGNCADVFVHDCQTGDTDLVSVSSDGIQGDNYSSSLAISADGRFIAFESHASNLVHGDTNDENDIFVHDRQTGETTRVSAASDGTQSNNSSFDPAISADGRFVTFTSWATNLVPDDSNGETDVFVHDRETGQTTRVSVASDGSQGNGYSAHPAISPDGRFVAFMAVASNLVEGDTSLDCGDDPDYHNCPDIFVHDRDTGQTTRVSVASDGTPSDSGSFWPSISADGRFVAFFSYATNLVSGDTNGVEDIFLHDRQTGSTTRVSVASDSTEGNDWSAWSAISSDGRFIAFSSHATNLVPGDTNDFCYDGRSETFTLNCADIFLRDRGAD